MASTFHIVLTHEGGFDTYDTREFDLDLDAKFAIGRSSKNTAKDHLQPGKHNAFIDSPVISREHAILTANTSAGTPHVFVTDTKSMHGTYVNGIPLVPHTPKQLSNGDKLQFGVNVNRNESYFVAYKYTFGAKLSEPESFSRGFTVPDAESEDEEVEFVGERRGSEHNPLTLDDSDSEAEPEYEPREENDQDTEHADDNNDMTMALDVEDVVEIIDSSVDEDATGSVAESMVGSDIESDDESTGSAPEYSAESPLLGLARDVEEVGAHLAVQEVQSPPIERDPLSFSQSVSLGLADSNQAPLDPFFADFGYPTLPAFSPPPQSSAPEVTNYVADESASLQDDVAPPLPPRPSQKRQRRWDVVSQEEEVMDGAVPSFVSLNSNEDNNTSGDLSAKETEPVHAFCSFADGIRTPPPTEAVDLVPSATTHKTGSSAMETIDAQPPAPTSITSRKRSAVEAFDEEAEHVNEQSVVELGAESGAPAQSSSIDGSGSVAIPTVQQVATQPQRPIAQPKSVLSRALRAAKVMVPATALGAVFTVTALTTLPESFFTVA